MNWRMALLLAGVAAISFGTSMAEQGSAWWSIVALLGGIVTGIAAIPAVKL